MAAQPLSSVSLSSVPSGPAPSDPMEDESVKMASALSEDDLYGGAEEDIESGDLQFTETAGLLSSATGSMESSAPAARKAAGGSAAAASTASSRLCSWLSVEYYQPYFDVDTADVGQRLKSACMPWKRNFLEVIGDRPDLYGPFWLSSTLVFTIAATANLSSWFVHDGEEPWQYDLALLTSAASLVYGCAVLMPAIAYFALKYLAVSLPLGLAQLICLYGYSIFAFVPACVLSAVPFASVQWISLLVAFGFSAGFLVGNLWGFLSVQFDGAEGRKRTVAILASLVGLHVVFGLLLKVWFFSRFA